MIAGSLVFYTLIGISRQPRVAARGQLLHVTRPPIKSRMNESKRIPEICTPFHDFISFIILDSLSFLLLLLHDSAEH